MIPDGLESFGTEVGNLWPLWLFISTLVIVTWRVSMVLNDMKGNLSEVQEGQKDIKSGQQFFVDSISEIQTTQRMMQEQLETNAGKSLRDAIDRMERLGASTDARMQAMIESSDIAWWETDENLVTKRWNQAYMDLWGFTSDDQVAGDGWLSQVRDDYYQIVIDRLTYVAAHPGDFYYDFPLKNDKWLVIHGKARWVGPESDHRNLIGYTGNVYYKDDDRLEPMVQQLVERIDSIEGMHQKFMERDQLIFSKLELNDAMHRVLLSLTGEALMLANEHQQTVWVSDATAKMFGRTPGQLVGPNAKGEPGRGWEDSIHPADIGALNGKYDEAFANARAESWKNMRIINPDTGELITWFDSEALPVDQEGDNQWYLGRLFEKEGPTD